MKKTTHLYVMVGVLGLGVSVRGDILELKNGTVLNGKYAGGTAGTVRFETGAGQQVIETSQAIGAIAGNAGKGAAIGATAGAMTKGQTITIPPGTLLEFNLMQPVTVPTAN
jgi:hypothetical protein